MIPEWSRSAGEGIGYPLQYSWTSPVAQLVKNPPANVGNLGLIPGWGRSRSPGERKGYPLQYSGPENFMDCHKESDMTERLSLSTTMYVLLSSPFSVTVVIYVSFT